ncbi:hypothetical protein HAV_00022 [Candidatus Hepatincola sp. Av]
MKLRILYIMLLLFISTLKFVKAEEIEVSSIKASVNQFIVIDFENAIVGMTVAYNRYGRMQVDSLSNKSLVLLLSRNTDDTDAIYKAFKGKIILSDNKCNKYLLNISVSQEKNNTEAKHISIKPKNKSSDTCESANKEKSVLYKSTMMLN